MAALFHRQAQRVRRARERDSDAQMDLLKLFGIFCVVYAHCYCHGLTLLGYGTVSSVYVIQLFLFASGYFHRTGEGGAALLRRCAARYLLPFFLWNLIYGLLRLALYRAGVLNFGHPLSLYTLFLQPWTDNEQFMLNLPSWFLPALFEVTMLTWLLRRLLGRGGGMSPLGDWLLLAGLLAVSCGAVALAGPREHHGLAGAGLRLLVLLPYYQLGILHRRFRGKLPGWGRWPLMALCLLALALARLGNGKAFQTKMLYGYFVGSPPLLVLTALCCVLLAMELCGLLAPLARRVRGVAVAGRCTMAMMQHHMLVLYGIQLFWYLLARRTPLPGYDPAAFRTSVWYRYDLGRPWLLAVYLLLALALPAALHLCYERVVLAADKEGL